MTSAPFGRRILAKLIDVALVAAALAPLDWLAFRQLGLPALGLAIPALLLTFVCYTAISEHHLGATAGKHALGLRVIAENGSRVSLGQAFARQLPLLTETVVIDGLAALVTGNRQRLFELASRTRVVVA